jgi:hypothetical protein
MTEIGYGMFDEKMFNRMPIALIVSDTFAVSTNWYQTAKGLKLSQIMIV